MGLLYLFELPLILFGIYALIFSNLDKNTKLAVFAWFLLAPLPASITTGVPHAVRTLNFLPTFQIFSALGLVSLILLLSKSKGTILNFKVGKIVVGLYLLFALFNFTYYLDQYFVQQNYFDSSFWQYGYKQAVSDVSKISNNYKQIVVSNDREFDKSYIFFLFYLKYPPKDYQSVKTNAEFSSIKHFDKYTFRSLDWQTDSKMKDTLFIMPYDENSGSSRIIQTIYNLDGTPAIKIIGS